MPMKMRSLLWGALSRSFVGSPRNGLGSGWRPWPTVGVSSSPTMQRRRRGCPSAGSTPYPLLSAEGACKVSKSAAMAAKFWLAQVKVGRGAP
jgi:hypothetical protein